MSAVLPGAAGRGAADSAAPRASTTVSYALLLASVTSCSGRLGRHALVCRGELRRSDRQWSSKIHPSTYLVCLLFGWVAITSRDPVAAVLDMMGRRPASTFLFFATLIFFARVVARPAPGMAGTLDAFVPAALLVMVLSRASSRSLAGVETVIHVLMTLNALLGLFEFASGRLVFPFRLDGYFSPYDLRSTALQGHPLQNATITAVYVLALLTHGGPAIGNRLRPILVLLQCAALVAFGGRSAMVVTCVLGACVLIWHAHRSLAKGKVSLLALSIVTAALTLLPLAVAGLAAAGFFDGLLLRFVSDGGSANARLVMLDIFDLMSWQDLLAGPDPEWLASVRRLNGLELGIENPIVRTLLAHGLIMTVLMTIAVALYLREVGRLSRGCLLPMLAFLIIINTFESLGGKTSLLTKFAVMMICFYRPIVRAGWDQVAARPSAASIGGSNARAVSSSNSPNPSNRFQ